MLHYFPFCLALVMGILLLVMLANRLKVAYPVVLVVAGLLISFLPATPKMTISPELIFVIFLPPLLYEAAWETSWKEFWHFRRVIGSFAFPVVIITSLVVAWVAHAFIPGFTLALGFLLGGIVSPPDAVSASAIMKNVQVNKHIRAIIEGESLLNDASSLVVFRFALIAVGTGQFVFREAALNFCWVIVAGIAVGLAVAYVFYLMHNYLPTDSNMDIVLTLVAPYAMYIIAEVIHVSGVLAVVSGGLFLSARSHRIFTNQGRIQAHGVWSALGFVLNGLVFMLVGLQLPVVVGNLGETSLPEAIGYGLLIAGVLMVGRILSALGAVVFTRVASRFITVAEANPGWRNPLILGWAGMRGVVSLAAALSIPVLLDNGAAFPQRNLILFITFIVILVTLLAQGLSLPWLIRKLKVVDADLPAREEAHNKAVHHRLAQHSLHYLKENHAAEIQSHPALKQLALRWENTHQLLDDEVLNDSYRTIYLKLLNEQRNWLREWNREFEMEEDIIRNHLMRIDLEEEKLKYS